MENGLTVLADRGAIQGDGVRELAADFFKRRNLITMRSYGASMRLYAEFIGAPDVVTAARECMVRE